jgi:carboxypeptidase Q
LAVIGLGLGAPGNVTAEVVVVRTFDELDDLGEANVKGKIVLFNEAWTEYGETVAYRSEGPSAAS